MRVGYRLRQQTTAFSQPAPINLARHFAARPGFPASGPYSLGWKRRNLLFGPSRYNLPVPRPLKLAPLVLALLLATSHAQTTVPFVGCPSDGQTGPLPAPQGQPKLIHIPAAEAQQLAFYKAEYSIGVLAPRGWNCFGAYGSNGDTLYVSPDPIDSAIFFSSSWTGFTGPAVQLSSSSGSTSGRFEVASVIARIFPARKQFVQDVIAEGIEPASHFPFGPYPNDKLLYKGPDTVEFQTPANQDGLGLKSRLVQSSAPISGVAIISGGGDEDVNLMRLIVRLPTQQAGLAAAMIHQLEVSLKSRHENK